MKFERFETESKLMKSLGSRASMKAVSVLTNCSRAILLGVTGIAFYCLPVSLLNAQQLPPGLNAQAGVSFGGAGAGVAGGLGGVGVGATGVGGMGSGGGGVGALGTTPTLPNIKASEQSLPDALKFASRSIALEPLKPNDFQQFVLQTTGQRLPIFGYQFFENINASQAQAVGAMQTSNAFAPAEGAVVSPEYPLGPGDQLIIRAWGSIDVDARVVVDRNGQVVIPKVGAVTLAGVKVSQSEAVIRQALAKNFKGFEVNVTLGQLRAITVYVVGQARRPGSYTLSSMSTLSSGLFASGGPNANGSLRRVQLKRADKLVTEFDLYDFLTKGQALSDVRLIDGDVIFIPPSEGYVALQGAINMPAVYEIKSPGEKLEQLMSIAGGLPVTTDPKRVTLERLTPEKSQPRSVQTLSLQDAGVNGLSAALQKGDLITFYPISQELSNAVTLRGHVAQPSRMPWKAGMRVSDLVPSMESLINPNTVRQFNEVLFDANKRERTLRDRQRAPSDLVAPGAQVQEAMMWSQATKIDGPKAVSLSELMAQAADEVNLDYATVERFNRQDLSTKLIAINLGAVLANTSDKDNITLQPGDVLTVFSINDIRVPQAKRRVIVRVEGEVNRPGVYQANAGETLESLLVRAGGLTKDAYLFGAGFYRQEVLKQQSENLEKILRKLESELSSSLAQTSQSLGASNDVAVVQAKLAAQAQIQKQSLERIRGLRPEGRISLSIQADTNNAQIQLPLLTLQNADKLFVPSRPDFVFLFGAVNTESALLYQPGLTVASYIERAGQNSSADKDSIILIRADGSALTSSSWWKNEVLSTKVMPGDTIVLPEKQDRESAWSTVFRNTKDVTQILYNLGLGAAAIKTLRQ